MSWSRQPICGACWQAYSYASFGEIRRPVQVIEAERETCCFCAGEARQGIYVRVETEKVPFPKEKVADPAAATAPTPNGHAPGLQDEST